MLKKYFQKPSKTFASLLMLFLGLYLWRASEALWIPALSDHISNFAITGGLIMLSIGPKQFELRASKKDMLQISVAYAFINVVLEFIDVGDIPLPGVTFTSFNTGDPIDAVFGLAAIMIIDVLYFKKFRSQSLKRKPA